jgi:hypothetical protein
MSAGRPTRTLTKAEFEHLLQRAVERDVYREPRMFTLPELVEAGQELGIDPISVEEVYAEYHPTAAGPLRPAREQPIGSRVHLTKHGDVLQLLVPPVRSRSFGEVFAIGVPGALVGVLGYAFEFLPFALPFSAALVALAGYRWHRGDSTSAFELRLFRDGSGVLLRMKGGNTKSYPLIAGQVHARLASIVEKSHDGAETFHIVALDHATKTHALMADFTHPERAWVVDQIESWLGR